MGGFDDEEEELQFFDAHEGVPSEFDVDYNMLRDYKYGLWTRSPQSVQERRVSFLNWMGLNSDHVALNNAEGGCGGLLKKEIDRITLESGAVLANPCSKVEFSSNPSSISNCTSDALLVSEKSGLQVCRIGKSGDGIVSALSELGGEQMPMPEGLENTSILSSEIREPRHMETKVDSNLSGKKNKFKRRWLNRLRSMTCMMDREGLANNLSTSHFSTKGAKVQRIKVQHCRKQCKELSALFIGQDILAHKGPILAMKFSLDGQYLATGGEDKIVCVWQVVEDARSNELDIPDLDPSCVYFTVNPLSELKPFVTEKEKLCKLKSRGKTEDSACVVFPPKVFRILEKPLHQFCGHTGEISDLSWSKNNYLLSSSIDKTVRLWQVGTEHCLKVFSHGNYVTCVQFNPLDDNHFITGSVDGKVRIWAMTGCRVVNWTDIRDIVTAVCYCPNGQGVVVGSMAGTCRYYDISDHFRMEAQIALQSKHSKKHEQCKKITGFQFLPQDQSKLMVTCADSKIRILHGINVVGKYKGVHNKGNQIIASLTSNGTHVVSTGEDSNVYIWNCISHDQFSQSRPKKIRSWERFFSTNVSVAIPWSGLKLGNLENQCQVPVLDETSNALPVSSPAHFSLGQEFVLESFPKGSATWPEEKLLSSSPQAESSAVRKSDYKFLKTCQNMCSSHAWDLIIVTAGWDGRIRSFHNYGLPVAL
ncbi:hypothetical protein NMG60_11017969 [Bertholletia excelsa]